MRQIIEVLRLKYESNLSHERIARACGISKGVVGKYISLSERHLAAAGRHGRGTARGIALPGTDARRALC